MEYYILGAGKIGQYALSIIGNDCIEGYVDNDEKKQGEYICGKKIISLQEYLNINDNRKQLVIAVSDSFWKNIEKQLKEYGITNYVYFKDIHAQIIKEKIDSPIDIKNVHNKAILWVVEHSIKGQGIINNTQNTTSYPEVTGYFIPSLLCWGHDDLAVSYAKWLCIIQKEDGSWYDTEDTAPYIFDTAQVLKGLLSIRDRLPEVDEHIFKGCDWIFSCMQNDGRLITPCKDAWGNDTDICDEVIHIYCLSPLIEAARIFDKPEYEEKARQIFEYYKKNYYEKIMNFSLLSHFYAYLMEALLDLGEIDMAKEAMSNIAKYQKESGAVPAYNNVDWVCSTGLFQLALVWFRLGEPERGDKAFEYACKLQNESGGWFGSYLSEENSNEVNTYIPTAEISWAVKYFLDALYFKSIS